MFTALVYKEWLKLRLVLWVPFLAVLTALGLVLVSFRHVKEMIGATMLWVDVALVEKVFYYDLRYVSVFAALCFALFQFVPECSGKRLRLLFHLPVPRRQAVYFMVGIGLACTALVCMVAAIGLAGIVGYYMPAEAVKMVLLTAAPWFLAGIPVYLGVVLVIMEPALPHKFLHGGATVLFVLELTTTSMQGAFEYSLSLYVLACLLWVLPIELAAYRFKRGMAW
ncbi:hypothetical protein [uncultured Pseudodesulfovibrio sp.]|uniref:hypothetical protein n=1 Tax=uncultured Pseudodesulfovibrio sp. TaxID=2035858 RepID=UPI0029C8FFF4|nr:hypothetical protein [uncultured Pseudodesulfovibrio sp.]